MSENIKVAVLFLGVVGGGVGHASLWGQTLAEPTAEPTAEQAVVPEQINQQFKDPDLEVGEWVDRFEGESREVFASREAILAALQLQPEMRVADVGAGTGFFSRLMASRLADCGWVYAIDISPAFIRHIAEVNREQGIRNITPILCSEDAVNLPPCSVDLVFICDTYHHFAYPDETLRSIRQAIKPGGHLVLIDFEREVGSSREWVLQHVRAGKADFRDEIIKAGFRFVQEIDVPGFEENYLLRFARP